MEHRSARDDDLPPSQHVSPDSTSATISSVGQEKSTSYVAETIAKGKILEDERVETIGHLANNEDHRESAWDAIRNQPWAFVWCVYMIWTLILTSFDNQAGGTILGIPQFRKDFGSYYAADNSYVLPAKWQSAYSGAPTAASVVGSFAAGYIGDRLGRKPTLLIGYIFCFTGISLEFVSTTNQVFFAGKLMAGLAIGGFISICMTYIGETAPLRLRGILTAAAALAFCFGPLIVAIIVNYTGTYTNRWAYRSTFVSEYGFSAIGFILLPFLPESPWWLIGRGKEDKAARSLARLGYDPLQIEKRLAIIALTLEEIKKETDGTTYLECFRRSNLRRTIIAIAPLSIQALSGVYFIIAYATYYQQLAGFATAETFKLSIASGILSAAGNVFSWFLIDRVGRRNLTLYGMYFLTPLLLICGGLACIGTVSATKGTVALILLYCFVYNLTIGSTAYSLLTEVATARLRVKTAAIGLSLQYAIYTMWAFVIPYLFNPNEANLGAKIVFIFGALAVFCTIYLWFYQPEVAGRSYEELDEMFMKHIPAQKFKTYKTDAEMKGERQQERVPHF